MNPGPKYRYQTLFFKYYRLNFFFFAISVYLASWLSHFKSAYPFILAELN